MKYEIVLREIEEKEQTCFDKETGLVKPVTETKVSDIICVRVDGYKPELKNRTMDFIQEQLK